MFYNDQLLWANSRSKEKQQKRQARLPWACCHLSPQRSRCSSPSCRPPSYLKRKLWHLHQTSKAYCEWTFKQYTIRQITTKAGETLTSLLYTVKGTSSLPSHLNYPLTVRVVGASRMISQPVSSIFSCFPLPSGTWQAPGLSIPWCCLPTSSTLSSSPFLVDWAQSTNQLTN